MSEIPSIAIVGGGLAGLATAAALAKFGFAAEVFEAASSLGEIGAGINVSLQAVRALLAIGLGDNVVAVANAAPGVLTRDIHSGEPLDYRDQSDFATRFGAPVCTIHRADLLDVLAQGVDPASVHLGHRLVGLEERQSSVGLRFANSVQHDAELVIAADGVHSAARRILYGHDNPAYTGQMAWRALVRGGDVPARVLEPSGHIQWLGSGRHFYGYYLRGREVVNVVTQQDTDQWVDEGWSIPGDADELRDSFPDPEPRLEALLSAVTQCSKWGLFTRPLTENWGRDRIQLIGDAAHAMLPMPGRAPRNLSRTPSFWCAGLLPCRKIRSRRWPTSAASAFHACTACNVAPPPSSAPSTITNCKERIWHAPKSTPSMRWRGSGATIRSAPGTKCRRCRPSPSWNVECGFFTSAMQRP